MKTLLVLRHAKSSWKSDDTDDHDRPLNKRGKRDAPRIGDLLKEANLSPDLIICSTAKRARKTAAKVAKNCGYQGVIELKGTLYLAPPDEYLAVLRDVDDANERVMIVGHNPGLEQLLAMLTGQPIELPTSALAMVDLDIPRWNIISRDALGQLIDLWRPRELE